MGSRTESSFRERQKTKYQRILRHPDWPHPKIAAASGVDAFFIDEGKQRGRTFGERYTNAFQQLFDQGYTKGVSIGNDAPDLTTESLLKTINEIQRKELVVGPSTDIDGNPVRGGDVIARMLPDGSFTEITPTPWVSRPDNVRNFFKTGITNQNNIAITSSGENGSSRLSYSGLRNDGIVPNTDLKRDGLAISLDQNVGERLKVKAFVNYINSRSGNRPNLGYGYENPLYGFNWTGRQTDVAALRDY